MASTPSAKDKDIDEVEPVSEEGLEASEDGDHVDLEVEDVETERDEIDEPDEEDGLGATSTVETVGPCKAKLNVEVPAEKVAELLDRNYQELISSLQLPGFRRGRAPRGLVEKRFGKEVEKDLKEALLSDSFLEVVQEHDLKVVGEPKYDNVNFDKDQAFRYEVEVETRPDFEIKKYKGLEVERPSAEVTDDEIEEELTGLRRRHGTREPVELASAGVEDFITASYRVFDANSEDSESQSAESSALVEKDEVIFCPTMKSIEGIDIPDLEKAFTERGENTVLRLEGSVSDDFPEEALRGKKLTVEATILEAKTVRLPELDEEFAKTVQAESIAELRSQIEDTLKMRREREAEAKMVEDLLEEIAATADVEVPEGLLESQKRAHNLRLQSQLMEVGMGKEAIEEELSKQEAPAEEEIRKDISRFFILEKIADKEKIFATEDDVEQRIGLYAQVYGRNPLDIARELESGHQIDQIRAEIRHSKVRKFLLEKAKVREAGNDSSKPTDESKNE